MANKRPKKKRTKLKKTAVKKGKRVKKAARKKPPPKKRLAKKKASPKAKTAGKKTASAKTPGVPRKRVAGRSRNLDTEAFAVEGLRSRSAVQSGDSQGLSNVEGADSESVDELIDEGNAFEADVVAGVESADDADEKEVHTHEVPEDDVPEEYLDKE
jgi:hypothetical protein